MATERVLSNLNLISFKTEGGLQNHIDELQDGDLAFTPDNSLKGNIFDFKWADHLLNDISWLRGDTFSWHDGEMYKAAYNHLVTDFEGTIAETETIGDIEITYYRAEDGHKICLPDQEDNILALYNATGVAWYYILDTANKQFKLPRSKHNKYADTVPVVGNGMALGITNGQISRAIGATTVHDSQTTTALMLSRNEPNNLAVDSSVTITNSSGNDLGTGKAYGVATTPDSSGLIAQQEQDTDQYKYLYFYVGNFERDAVEQTAGITVETLNGKADSDLGNIPANYDYVVESQEPTAENGYTWYRKYKSGWVEQGGINTQNTAGANYATITLPITMSDTHYTIMATKNNNDSGSTLAWGLRVATSLTTTTTFAVRPDSGAGFHWQVSGMAAQ